MKSKIYHNHPRNFANECVMVLATTPAEVAYAEDRDYEYLTRAEARKHIRFVNAENDSWGSNRAFGKMGINDILTVAQYWEGHFNG